MHAIERLRLAKSATSSTYKMKTNRAFYTTQSLFPFENTVTA